MLNVLAQLAAMQVTCQICFESYPLKSMHASMCNHYFCEECWEGYVSNAISEGPAALNLRCPLPDCKAAVCLPNYCTCSWVIALLDCHSVAWEELNAMYMIAKLCVAKLHIAMS